LFAAHTSFLYFFGNFLLIYFMWFFFLSFFLFFYVQFCAFPFERYFLWSVLSNWKFLEVGILEKKNFYQKRFELKPYFCSWVTFIFKSLISYHVLFTLSILCVLSVEPTVNDHLLIVFFCLKQ
jgi:hypothetical protein